MFWLFLSLCVVMYYWSESEKRKHKYQAYRSMERVDEKVVKQVLNMNRTDRDAYFYEHAKKEGKRFVELDDLKKALDEQDDKKPS